MDTNEKIRTLEQRHANELQQKREEILALETRVAKLEEEIATQENLVSRYVDELSRFRRSSISKYDALVEMKVREFAQEFTKLLKLEGRSHE